MYVRIHSQVIQAGTQYIMYIHYVSKKGYTPLASVMFAVTTYTLVSKIVLTVREGAYGLVQYKLTQVHVYTVHAFVLYSVHCNSPECQDFSDFQEIPDFNTVL